MAVLGTATTRRNSVRKLAGSLTTKDISDADLDTAIERWDEWVQAKTGRTDWKSTDFGWKLLLAASDYMASAEILAGLPGKENKDEAASQRIAARDAVKSINKKDDEVMAQDHTDAIFADINVTDELHADFYTKTLSESY